ncbi:YciI family protein [Paenibacillus sp. EPM92]|uniref:YciI family protein n=1 Tax=Paenibacillus sp. EPM92 TaxID=1561195 RepID=UPI0019163A4F|nr:YciI family protein [Paenibacillus sp. EPM92]
MWLVQLGIKKSMDQIDPSWFEQHNNRNQQLREKGVIAANGPFADGSGGCIVYNCSKEEFVSIIESDPLVVNGVVDYEYKEWNAAF